MAKDVWLMLEKARANDNEPVFVFRAKDLFATKAIVAYLDELTHKTNNPAIIADVSVVLQEFIDWRDRHSEQVRFPD